MSALAIKQMSWDEKLPAMEELWESLSREESRLESPAWHQEALRVTAVRHQAGNEQPIDWIAGGGSMPGKGRMSATIFSTPCAPTSIHSSGMPAYT
jgi:hypothetical protein